MRHPEEEFSAYIDGELNSDEVQEIEVHLKDCPKCVDKLSKLRQLNEVLRSAPEMEPSPGFSKRVMHRLEQDRQSRHTSAKWMVLGLAAVILFVVLILRIQQQAVAPVQVNKPKVVVSKPRIEKTLPPKPEPVVAEKKPERPAVKPMEKPPIENPPEEKAVAEVKPENQEVQPENTIAEVQAEKKETPEGTQPDELTSEEVDLIANLDEVENMDVISNYDQLENLEIALFSAGEEKHE